MVKIIMLMGFVFGLVTAVRWSRPARR